METIDLLINRIRMLLGFGLARDEVHFQLMTGDKRPSEGDFFLAYTAAEMANEYAEE